MIGCNHENFTLDCGHDVSLTDFEYRHAYGDYLEVEPRDEIHEKIIKTTLKGIQKRWGERTTYVVPPVIRTQYQQPKKPGEKPIPHPELPCIEIVAYLTSRTTKEPGFDGSELIVIWYRNEWKNESLRDVIYDGIRTIPWDDVAEDFFY